MGPFSVNRRPHPILAIVLWASACQAPVRPEPETEAQDNSDWRTRLCDPYRPFSTNEAADLHGIGVSAVAELYRSDNRRCHINASIYIGVNASPAALVARVEALRRTLRGADTPERFEIAATTIAERNMLLRAAGVNRHLGSPEADVLVATLIDAADPHWWVDFESSTTGQRHAAMGLAMHVLHGLSAIMDRRVVQRLEALAARDDLEAYFQFRNARFVVNDALAMWRWRQRSADGQPSPGSTAESPPDHPVREASPD